MSERLKRSLVRFGKMAVASMISSVLLFINANPSGWNDYETYLAGLSIAAATGLLGFIEKWLNWKPEEVQN